MLNTPPCELFGIEVPIVLAPMGTCTSGELAAAVSNEGGLGEVGSLFRTTAAIKRDIDMVRKLTNRHFGVNHIPQCLDAEAFRYTLEARPAAISFAQALDAYGRTKRSNELGCPHLAAGSNRALKCLWWSTRTKQRARE